MFKYYFYNYINYYQKSDKYDYEITIVDEDFRETQTASHTAKAGVEAAANEVINIYSKRNLDVSKNLIQFMKNIRKINGLDYNFDNQIFWYKEYINNFDKYLPKIEKYLILE